MTQEYFPCKYLETLETPFYCYNLQLLNRTLDAIQEEANKFKYEVHYAVKANANAKILDIIASRGLGADCVSGNEVLAAINSGFANSKIVFAGVGKTDKEIRVALEHNINCFNVESLPELMAINEIAGEQNKIAKVALRINPNVDANTHKYITTGKSENKFGFQESQLENVISLSKALANVKITGIHFHIGSQITDLNPFIALCQKCNNILAFFEESKIDLDHVNMGGGLGIDYDNPEKYPICDFKAYFGIFNKHLNVGNKKVCFELGRSIVAQCGSLITKVVYVKEGINKKFAIVDAGMTDLIRPALYQAKHKIVNITTTQKEEDIYDIVGPICESSDTFAENYTLSKCKRGDLLAILSAGAYGEVMASRYNLRDLPASYFFDL